MRIGVFGGTFDPIHLGHLILAEQCREQAALDQVLFVPAARPPHKIDQVATPFAQRVEMLSLAIAGHPAFRIDELERDRPGPSFMADTLKEIQDRDPKAELFLLLGSDSLQDLPSWAGPQRIAALATLLVVTRSGSDVMPAERMRAFLRLPGETPLRLQAIDMPGIDIASRDLRRRCAEGESIRFLVPRAVEIYIKEKHLYSGS